MQSKFTYLLIDFATILVPFVFSFYPKINFYKTWKAFWPANLIIAFLFILWDVIYTHIGVWGFNDHYTCGLKLLNLPIEEVLFFICIPYASIFTYHCLKLFLKNSKVYIKHFSIFFSVSLLAIGLLFISNLYTSITFISLASFIIFLKYFLKVKWLYNFYVCYLIILLPFFIVNGILTGSWIDEPIVWYNNQENLHVRLLTIPVEDVFYGMLLLLLNTWLYERFSEKNRKRKILIFPFDLMSHYLRCLVLAKQYTDDDVLFAYSKKYDSFVKDAGYSTFAVECFDSAKIMECAAKFDFSWLNEQDIERVFKSQVNAIKNLKPDIVIGDTSPTLRMAAELNGIPFISLMNGYMSRYYMNVRALSKTHPGYDYLSKLPPSVSNKIIEMAETISFRLIHKPFRTLRRKYKLKSVRNYIHEMEGDENLICDYDFLFPQKKLPNNYRVIGPLKYSSRNKEDAIISQLDSSKKTICVCMGSSGNWEKLGFLSSSKYDSYNIITAGDIQSKIQGKHIIAQNFVSLEMVLPYCNVLICHGGNGTIYHGIVNKIHLLCLTDNFEQEWNVQQLEAHKLGTCINEDPQEKLDAFLNR